MRRTSDLKSKNAIIQDISIIDVSREQDFEIRQNFRLYDTLIYIVDGKIRCTTNHGTIEANQNHLIYIPKGECTVTKYIEQSNRAICINLTLNDKDVIFEGVPRLFDGSQLPRIRHIVESIYTKLDKYNIYDKVIYMSYSYELLYTLFNIDRNVIDLKYKCIISVIEEINRNYNKNLKIDEYAKMAVMCESSFRKLFKEYTGKSPIEYRNNLRILRADELIKSGEFNSSEAAIQVGFSSFPYFCREYKKTFGTTSIYKK